MGLSNQTLATGSVAGQGFGVGMSAVGAFYKAEGQKAAYKAQAEMSDLNAHLDELTAQSALLQGERQEQAVRLKGAQTKSSQKASMAARGVSLSSPTAINILTTTDVMSEIDANTVNANAARSAWGYKMQAVNERSAAAGARIMGNSINPAFSALGTFVTDATSVAKSYYKLDKEGAFQDTSTKTTIGGAAPAEPGWFQRNFPETYKSIF